VDIKYGILFSLDQEMLQKTYGDLNYGKAYSEIKDYLENAGFKYIQGNIFIGNGSAVDAVVTVQKLSKKFNWFKSSVKTLKLLRIDGYFDLSEAL
jgi:virulence-associated protein VapD